MAPAQGRSHSVSADSRSGIAMRHASPRGAHHGSSVAALKYSLILIAAILSAATLTVRSEEHTSELQSRRDLVCRLLLEKKKNEKKNINDKKKNTNVKYTI